jgi:hypothetical protein
MKTRLSALKEKGGTLVDVVMAVAIIGIMCIGLVGSLTYGYWTMGTTRENQRATQIMLETVETIRLYNWDQVNSNGFIPATFSQVYDPQGSPGGITYYGVITTNRPSIGATINSNLMQMTVVLNWTNTRGMAHHRTNVTYIAKDGLQNYVY